MAAKYQRRLGVQTIITITTNILYNHEVIMYHYTVSQDQGGILKCGLDVRLVPTIILL